MPLRHLKDTHNMFPVVKAFLVISSPESWEPYESSAVFEKQTDGILIICYHVDNKEVSST